MNKLLIIGCAAVLACATSSCIIHTHSPGRTVVVRDNRPTKVVVVKEKKYYKDNNHDNGKHKGHHKGKKGKDK